MVRAFEYFPQCAWVMTGLRHSSNNFLIDLGWNYNPKTQVGVCMNLYRIWHQIKILYTFFGHLMMHSDPTRVCIMQNEILCIKSSVLVGTQSVPT